MLPASFVAEVKGLMSNQTLQLTPVQHGQALIFKNHEQTLQVK